MKRSIIVNRLLKGVSFPFPQPANEAKGAMPQERVSGTRLKAVGQVARRPERSFGPGNSCMHIDIPPLRVTGEQRIGEEAVAESVLYPPEAVEQS